MSAADASAASVTDVARLFAAYHLAEAPFVGGVRTILVTHSARWAEILATRNPDDHELRLTGLLRDVGLLVPGTNSTISGMQPATSERCSVSRGNRRADHQRLKPLIANSTREVSR